MCRSSFWTNTSTRQEDYRTRQFTYEGAKHDMAGTKLDQGSVRIRQLDF